MLRCDDRRALTRPTETTRACCRTAAALVLRREFEPALHRPAAQCLSARRLAAVYVLIVGTGVERPLARRPPRLTRKAAAD
jgi:hypothetical protein